MSNNQAVFPAEVNIHIPGQSHAGARGVFVFPKLLVCLSCGFSSFTTMQSKLLLLANVASTEAPAPMKNASNRVGPQVAL
jgi:hypothetical protein